MSDIRWIKVAVDMFEDSKIEFIRSLPEGDAIIVTWIQMLSIAGSSNMGGYLMVTSDIPYTEQLLATKLRRSPVFMQFALETLIKLKMVNFEDGPYHITNWEKHQNVDGMDKVRIQNKERKQRQREREKQLLLEQKTNMSRDGHVTVTEKVTHEVTPSHAIDIDKDKEKDIKHIVGKPDIPHSEIIAYLNARAGTNFKASTKATKEQINGRWRDGFRLDDFKAVIDAKCADWVGTSMEEYLRPTTLFNASKFESYLNHATKPKEQKKLNQKMVIQHELYEPKHDPIYEEHIKKLQGGKVNESTGTYAV